MKNLSVISSILLPLLLCSCRWITTEFRDVTATSYVCEYMKLSKVRTFGLIHSEYGNEHSFLLNIGGYSVSVISDEPVYGLYMDLCKKHNDTDFVHTVRVIDDMFYSYSYCDLDPVSIDVISDADFDEKHPAGTSLADLFYFNSVTPYPFIKNGYKGEELTVINQRLDLLTPEEMILSMHRGKLIDDRNFVYPPGTGIKQPFISLPAENLPTLSQTHTFTITIVDDYGRTFTGKVTVEF